MTRRRLSAMPLAAAVLATALAAVLAAGCGKPASAPSQATTTAGQPAADQQTKETAMSFELSSTAFKHNERVPKEYTGEGRDVSPPLSWRDAPSGTQAFALICDDPDAPMGTWVHWVIWNIPAGRTDLPVGVPRTREVKDLDGARQGANSWKTDNLGYRGPMPPPGHGPHRYNFALYALNQKLDLAAGASKKDLINAMAGHILGEAHLTAKYER